MVKKNWIEKNMGISRKTLTTYERCGLIKPARNASNGKYREFNEEELERVWHIKFFVELGYSLKEVKNLLDNPSFDFHKSIAEKLEKLEAKKNQLEQLIGLAKFIKATGIFPSVPKEMGTIKFEDFLKYSYESLNVDTDRELTNVYQTLNLALSDPNAEWDEEKTNQLLEEMLSNPDTDVKALLTLHSYWVELAGLSHHEVSHPDVQSVVKKMYDYEKNTLFHECSDTITPQWYAQHASSYFSGSDMAIVNQKNFGTENCEFIARAIDYFGSHAE